MNNRGSIVFSLLLVLILTILGALILLRGVNESKIANRYANSTQAFWLTEAGIQQVVWEINTNNCTGMVQAGTNTACASCSSCGGGNKTKAATITGAGDYDVVLNNANTLITSQGSYPSRTSSSKIQRNIQGSISHQSPFSFAAFAQGQVTLANNTFIDSYNSNNGAYSVANSNTNGDIGSNGTTAGIISIGNNISLGGDVSTGVGGTNTAGSGTVITGTITHTNNYSMPDVSVPATLTGLASSGALSVSNGGTTALPAGNYKYTDISMANNGTLNINGTVKLYLTAATAFSTGNNTTINIASGASLELYVDGVLSIPNNVNLNSSGNVPKNFQVYSAYTGSKGISINNNGVLAVAVYAPKTNVIIGNNNDLYGSLIGKTVSVNNNSAIHYDEALSTINSSIGSSRISVWQET